MVSSGEVCLNNGLTREKINGQVLSKHNILRFNSIKCAFDAVGDVIVVEDMVNLYLNKKFYASFRCLSQKIREMIIGHLFTEGIIDGIDEIVKIDFSERNIYVQTSKEVCIESNEIISTACGEANKKLRKLPKAPLKLELNKCKFSVEIIFKAVRILNSMAKIFRSSGGTHAATILSEDGGVIAFAEDIGRHNAIDKVVGEAIINGADLTRVLLASSGRLTSEIVMKAAYVGIPMVVSISAPTSMGIKVAETFGLTLIGFARGKRFNIYTFPDRIYEYSRF